MSRIVSFAIDHWLSLLLLAGLVTAVWFVVRRRDKLMRKPF